MVWVVLIVLAAFSVGMIIYDAATDQWERRPRTAGELQRYHWWWKTRYGLILAIAVGLFITVSGILLDRYNKDDANWLEVYMEWARHFGPELFILAFATKFVEGKISQGEERRDLRFRSVKGFMVLVSYALNHHLYFDGGSSNFLEMERNAIEKRSNGRKRVLWDDEKRLFDAAYEAAIEFIDDGLRFAWAVDQLDSARSQLRIDLLSLQPDFSDWNAIASLEANMRAAFRRVPLEYGRPELLTIDDLLDGGRREDWEEQTAALKGQWPAIAGRLDLYFLNDRKIVQLRVDLLNNFHAFQRAAIAFRDRVWESDDPDE